MSTGTYLKLVPSANRLKPKFAATLLALVQPIADEIDLLWSVIPAYALDTAVGAQLDTLGAWIGASRDLTVPITGALFSFDTVGLGFDEGVWNGGGTSGGTVISLDDDTYRLLVRARVLNNQWDGTIDYLPFIDGQPDPNDHSAYRIWDALFAGTGYTLFIVDHGDLSMTLGLLYSGTISALAVALFTGGYLSVKPAGVRIRDYIVASGMPPIFALDSSGADFAGLDIGSWAVSVT
jgi:hypothetical protein